MKNILFLALFGLLFVNSTLHAQKDPELKKPGMKLQPTYVHAHDGGKPIPAELVLEIQRTGNKSFAPLPALQWATEYRLMTIMGTFEGMYYRVDPEKYLGPKVGWHDKINNPDNGFLAHNKLGPGRKIWTYGWLPQDFTASDGTVFLSGWYFFERNLYVVGEKGYVENEGTIDLDMGKIFHDVPEMQGVYIAWYADGCANPSLPTEVPFTSQETVSNDPQPRRKGYVDPFYGSNWNVSVGVQQSYGMMQPAPQYFSYGNMGWGQGYGYNCCPSFMPMPMLNNCFNCGGYGGGSTTTTTTTNNYYNNNYHYGGNTINEGDNIVINEGDNIIIFPPPVVDKPTPPIPPDDGGPVDPPNGENPGPNDDGGPVDPPNGEGLVNNGRNNSSNNNGNNGNNNGGPSDAGNGMRTQNNENSIARQVSSAGSNRETTSFSEIDSRVNAADKSWNSQKDALLAQREQRIQSDNSSRFSSTPSTAGSQRETQQSSLRSNTTGREFNSPSGTSSNSQVGGVGRNNPVSQTPQVSVRELNRSESASANTGRVQGNPNTSTSGRVAPSPSTSTSSTTGRNTGGTTSTTSRVPELTQSRVSSSAGIISSNQGRGDVSSSRVSSSTGRQVPVMSNNVSTGRSQTVQTTPSSNTGRMLPSPQVQNGGRQFNSTPSVPPAARMSAPVQQPSSFRGGGGMGMPSARMSGGGRR